MAGLVTNGEAFLVAEAGLLDVNVQFVHRTHDAHAGQKRRLRLTGLFGVVLCGQRRFFLLQLAGQIDRDPKVSGEAPALVALGKAAQCHADRRGSN